MGDLAVALLALLLLNYASVQSIVMQANGAAWGAPMCGQPRMDGLAMPGMSVMAAMASPHPGGKPAPGASHQAACPYCAAAANPPIAAEFQPPRVPTAFVFVAFTTIESHGPRGPPAREPRARGPPSETTSI